MAKRRRNSVPRSTFFLLLWLIAFFAPAVCSIAGAAPVILHLKNGDRLSGSVLAEDASRITITNSILGRLTVPLAEVAKRETPALAIAAKPTPPPMTNAPAMSPELRRRIEDLQTLFAIGAVSAEEFQRRRIELSAPPPSRPKGPKPWTAEVFAGLDMVFSEKDRQLYTGRAKLTYTKAPLRNNVDYLFTYGWTDGELTANRMDGWMKTDWDLTPRTYLYNLGGAGYDEIRRVDWRYEVGPGVGYHLVKLTNFVFRVEGGLHYQVQDFPNSREEKTYYQRLAQDLRWNIGTQFTFDEKVEYFPDLTDLHSYRLRMEANLRYWLASNLSLNFTVIDTYDTKTARGVGQNDLQIRSSIGVKF